MKISYRNRNISKYLSITGAPDGITSSPSAAPFGMMEGTGFATIAPWMMGKLPYE